MSGEFGAYIDEKRRGKAADGTDIKLKDIADAMGKTATYLSDIIKGRRNPPEMELLEKIANILMLNKEEREHMFDLAGRDREEVSPDLPEYIMDQQLTYARIALRKAKDKKLGNEFWKKVSDDADKE